ncbi:Succinate dehydrogenase assembly factor [Candidatus Trichorickettsia mobilis]|uniref:FAD assembly factor SdhE n=1 Tax=Candidatus Trichorickettsia mobilis TaxID=1346319 RepID=A0ABZ0UTU7_9RICK|nr:succinate dehydrogenase assembly factor 2 [Candidatus Trichorickettsia mobilis]WPY01457.1 Succinate dehydrogenase assembly factor [Candidatus Trichorickettsia mobilis]
MNSQDLSLIRKKLLYKSKHRGCKETDLILGKFAEEFIFSMNSSELTEFAKILEQNDADIYDWCSGKTTPSSLNSKIMHKLLEFSVDIIK